MKRLLLVAALLTSPAAAEPNPPTITLTAEEWAAIVQATIARDPALAPLFAARDRAIHEISRQQHTSSPEPVTAPPAPPSP